MAGEASGWGLTICITGVKSISVLFFFFQTGLEGGLIRLDCITPQAFFFNKHLPEVGGGGRVGGGQRGRWVGEGKRGRRATDMCTMERNGDARKKQGREGLICDEIQEPTKPT